MQTDIAQNNVPASNFMMLICIWLALGALHIVSSGKDLIFWMVITAFAFACLFGVQFRTRLLDKVKNSGWWALVAPVGIVFFAWQGEGLGWLQCLTVYFSSAAFFVSLDATFTIVMRRLVGK